MQELNDIVEIKSQVLYETARHAFKGDLETSWFDIPYEMIKGGKPNFRCCVYRERAIIRQRVKMAMGKLPHDTDQENVDSDQIVYVISSACEGCPITKITVTQNCRGCLAKKCIKACPFGAISTSDGHAVIDKKKCRECGKCVAACPYNAIVDIERPCKNSCAVGAISMDENDVATIDPNKCINCGSCVIGCPFGAISDLSMMTDVIKALNNKERKIYAMVAPAIEGQFGDVRLPEIKAAIKKLGFDGVYEVALGADIVAYNEAQELVERIQEGKKMTSSCCPAFVNLINKHYPELSENVSTTVSPMVAIERYIKASEPDAMVVFIGPCIAKKNEVVRLYQDEIEFALTFEELNAMLAAKEIKFEDVIPYDDKATRYGKGFAMSGGVSQAVGEVLREREIEDIIETTKCSGAAECKKTLTLFKVGRLKEDFVEGMYCEGGCIAGPATLMELNKSRRLFEKFRNDNKKENITKNFERQELGKANPHRPQ